MLKVKVILGFAELADEEFRQLKIQDHFCLKYKNILAVGKQNQAVILDSVPDLLLK